MIARSRFVLGLLLLSFLAAGSVSGLEIRGTALLEDGSPAQGAMASLLPVVSDYERAWLHARGRPAAQPMVQSRVGAGGHFSLTVPAAGLWRVVVQATGHAAMERTPVPVVEDVTLPPVSLPEEEPRFARLVDAQRAGVPVAGAWVAFRGSPPSPEDLRAWRGWRPHQALLRSDEEGRVRVPRFPRHAQAVVYPAWGGAQAFVFDGPETPTTLRVSGGGPPVDVEESIQSIKVVDRSGQPSAGVLILVGGEPVPRAITGEDGRATLRLRFSPEARQPRREITLLAPDGRRWTGSVPVPSANTGELEEDEKEEKETEATVLLPPARTHVGRVVDGESRRPLAGCLLWLEAEPGAWTSTGREGFYEIVSAAPGPPGVRAVAAGFFPGRESGSSSVLALEPAVQAEGRVVTADGRPVSGARIRVEALWQGAGPPPRRVAPVWSWADGSFRLSPLSIGVSHRLTALAEGFAPAETLLPAATAEGRAPFVRIVLGSGHTVRGRVVDEGALPVPGARVVLLPAGDLSTRKSVIAGIRGPETDFRAAATSDQGTFVLRHISAGRYDLVVTKTSFSPLEQPGIEIAGEESEVDLGVVELLPAVAIEGRIVNEQGAPVSGARVLVSLLVEAGSLGHRGVGEIRSGEEGRFRVPDLARGDVVELRVEHAEYGTRVLSEIIAPTPRPLEIVLPLRTSLAGRVLDEAGQPVAGAQVLARPEGTRTPMLLYMASTGIDPRGQTDGEGRFEIAEVEPGRLRVIVRANGYQPATRSSIEAPPGARIEGLQIVLESGANVSGRVLDAEGRAVQGTWVEGPGARQRTGGDGGYRLEGLVPGRHRISAWHPETDRRATVEIDLGAESLEGVDLVFDPAFSLSGKVTDSSGELVADALIRVWSPDNATVRTGASHEDGSFRIPSVGDGVYGISASREGLGPSATREVEVRGESVRGLDLTLPEGAVVAGRVLGLEPGEIGHLTVAARQPGERVRFASLGPDGSYRIPNLGPGEWLVTAALQRGARRAEGRVELTPGESVILDLELGAGWVLEGRLVVQGEPQVAAWVTLSTATGAVAAGARSDADGWFRLEGLSKGLYQLDLATQDRQVQLTRALELQTDQVLEIDVPVGGLTGRLVDANSGEPLSGGRLELLPVGSEWTTDLIPVVRPVAVSFDGTFVVDRIPSGRYRLRTTAPGFAERIQEIRIPERGWVEAGSLALEPLAAEAVQRSTASGSSPTPGRSTPR